MLLCIIELVDSICKDRMDMQYMATHTISIRNSKPISLNVLFVLECFPE